MNHWWEKDMSGCGLSGIINTDGKRISGAAIRESIAIQHDRGNGLGGGFAAYGIYPEYKDYYALHIMYTEEPGKPTRDLQQARKETEAYLDATLSVKKGEDIPVKITDKVRAHPLLEPLLREGPPGQARGVRRHNGGRLHRQLRHAHKRQDRQRVRILERQEHGRLQGRRLPRGHRGFLHDRELRGLHLDGAQPLPDEHPGLVGRGAPVHAARLVHRP